MISFPTVRLWFFAQTQHGNLQLPGQAQCPVSGLTGLTLYALHVFSSPPDFPDLEFPFGRVLLACEVNFEVCLHPRCLLICLAHSACRWILHSSAPENNIKMIKQQKNIWESFLLLLWLCPSKMPTHWSCPFGMSVDFALVCTVK